MTFGEKLNLLRKKTGLTQEEVAQHLGISPQAVSKWENDLSCPDIMLLPEIAKLYGKTVDELLSGEDFQESCNEEVKAVSEDNSIENKQTEKTSGNRKVISEVNHGNMFLKVNVVSQNGDKVDVKLPVALLKSMKGLLGSIKLNDSMTGGIDLSEIDFDAIFELVDKGVMGEIVNIVSQNGDTIKVYVESEPV